MNPQSETLRLKRERSDFDASVNYVVPFIIDHKIQLK